MSFLSVVKSVVNKVTTLTYSPSNPIILPDSNIMWESGAVGITTYPIIYVKSSYWAGLSTALKAVFMNHENTHLSQQKSNVALYALKYAIDKTYRLSMEVEAYGAEVTYYIGLGYSKAVVLNMIATLLASSTYLNMCTYAQAIAALKAKYPKLLV